MRVVRALVVCTVVAGGGVAWAQKGPDPTKAATVPKAAAREAAGHRGHGQLHFNLHTTGQTYYGDIRGQILPAKQPPAKSKCHACALT